MQRNIGKSIACVKAAAGAAAALLMLAFASPSFAAGAGGGHGGGLGGPAVGGFGGSSAPHISPQGTANSNGPNALDRDVGLDRARDRMSAEGLQNNKVPDSDDAQDRGTRRRK